MKCRYCGSENNVIDYDNETKYCRCCGNIVNGDGVLIKTARLLDFFED